MKNLFLSLFLCISFLSFSQNKEDETQQTDEDLILESLLDEDADKDVDDLLAALFKEQKDLNDLMESFSNFKFLYISANYTSDTYFAGRDIGWNDYNLRPQITYLDAKGFFASIGGAYYDGTYFDPRWDFTSLSAGYGRSFGKNNIFRVSGGYTRFIYSKKGSNPFTNSISAGIAVRNKKRTLGTRLSLNESFGDDNSFQIGYSAFGVINILDKEKYRLQLRPRLNILAGQQTFFEETGEFDIEIEDGIPYEVPRYNETSVFDLMNVQISLPILYTTEKWDVEVGFNRNFPYEIGNETKEDNTGFINVSVGYLLEL
ncbi:hypothetical protein [Wenyingzhuangia sp. IMCC45574]